MSRNNHNCIFLPQLLQAYASHKSECARSSYKPGMVNSLLHSLHAFHRLRALHRQQLLLGLRDALVVIFAACIWLRLPLCSLFSLIFVQVSRIAILDEAVVHLAKPKDCKTMSKFTHLIEHHCICAKPTESLFCNGGVERAKPLFQPRLRWMTRACASMAVRMEFVDCIELQLLQASGCFCTWHECTRPV